MENPIPVENLASMATNLSSGPLSRGHLESGHQASSNDPAGQMDGDWKLSRSAMPILLFQSEGRVLLRQIPIRLGCRANYEGRAVRAGQCRLESL